MIKHLALAIAAATCLVVPVAGHADNPAEAKLCLFYAAGKLPQIPGLVIRDSKVKFANVDSSLLTPMNIYKGEIEVQAVGQKAVYSFTCPVAEFGLFDSGFQMALAR